MRSDLSAAALDEAIQMLAHRLAHCRMLNQMTYTERVEVFRRIDVLQAEAEIFMCEAPDYPDDE